MKCKTKLAESKIKVSLSCEKSVNNRIAIILPNHVHVRFHTKKHSLATKAYSYSLSIHLKKEVIDYSQMFHFLNKRNFDM